MIIEYSRRRLLSSVFFVAVLLQACTLSSLSPSTTYNHLTPPTSFDKLLTIPYQTIYKTENFVFQPPLSQHWELCSFVNINETATKKNKITIYNGGAQAWISVAYLSLAEGKRFETHKDLINAFVAGEQEYLTGNLNAPVTGTHLLKGFTKMFNSTKPKTMKIGEKLFKVLKWDSISEKNQKKFHLEYYVRPAKDLSGVFVIAMVSPMPHIAGSGNIIKDLEVVVANFDALR